MNGLMKAYAKQGLVVVAVLGLLASVATAAPVMLTNGVPVTGLSGAIGSQAYYAIVVPSGQDDLEIAISGGTGDCDLYVKRGSEPTTTSYDYRPYEVGNNETVNVESPAAGTWYIMLRGYNAYSGLTLVATYSASLTVVPLTNGVPVTDLSGAAGTEVYFSIDIPAGQSKLQIAISGGTGDCDLYVKRGALPTTSDYDYRPFLVGNEETVTVNNPTAGTWYIMLRGYSAYAGLSLLASYGGGVGTLLENGVPVTGLTGTQGSEQVYRIEVPAGQSNLEISIAGGTGDADLYVKYGAQPSTSDYDYRPFLAGNDETVTVPSPTAGTWYIMVRGYSSYADVTLKASYGDIITLEDGVPVTGLAASLNTTTYYKIEVPAGKSTLEVTIAGGTGNADLYVKYGAKPTVSSWDYRPYLSGNTETVTVSKPAAGTWYIMLRARQAYSGVTLEADYWFSGTVTLLTNGVPVTGIADSEGGQKYFRIVVPSGQSKLEIQISGGTGDADLYVKYDSVPTTTDYDYRPYEIGNDETVTIDNPASGDWLIMIRGYHAYSGLTLVATHGTGGGGGTVTTLNNGVPVTGLSAATGVETYYKIEVPSGQASLEIAISGGTGDADMYVRQDAKPTTSEWDYRPYLIGNNETVTVTNPTAGTWYIMLRAYQAYADLTIVATYKATSDNVVTLSNGVPLTDLSAATGTTTFYKIVVPAGQDFLSIAISGGTGDCDLYVRKGSKPTTSTWDYRPYLIGNNESVDITTPAAATWYIMLRAYQAYAGLSLVATYGTDKPAGNNFAADPNCVALWRFEPGELEIDSVGTNDLTNAGAVSREDGYQEGAGSVYCSGGSGFILDEADLDDAFPFKSTGSQRTISLTCWFTIDSIGGGTHCLYFKGDGYSNRTFGIGVADDAKIEIVIGYQDGTNSEEYNLGATTVQLHQWYHLGVTFDGHAYRIRLYDPATDAVYNKTGNFRFPPQYIGDAPQRVGKAPYYRSWDGLLDEMAVFNDVLTESEIDQIRQGTYGKK